MATDPQIPEVLRGIVTKDELRIFSIYSSQIVLGEPEDKVILSIIGKLAGALHETNLKNKALEEEIKNKKKEVLKGVLEL